MRSFLFALAALGLLLAPSTATAQSPPVTMANPSQYAADVANLMSRRGVAPLREIYNLMFGATLPANIEAALIAYERAIDGNTAVIGRVVETTTLADSFRSIYMYHYFGNNAWIFTRLDFVRISETEWALSTTAFSSEWSGVVSTTTPGFSSR